MVCNCLCIRFCVVVFYLRGRMLLWSIVLFSFLVILSQVAFLITWAIECGSCDAEVPWWSKLLGFMIVETWRSPIVIYLLIVQLLVVVIAFVELHESRLGLFRHASTLLRSLSSAFDGIVVGIRNSSWVSLPFFVCSYVGLVDWSLTSNFHGLFRSGVRHTNVLLRGAMYILRRVSMVAIRAALKLQYGGVRDFYEDLCHLGCGGFKQA
ncbi:hypothetical protein Hanom_Chr07g00618971 [Helianthus anomalus]